MSVEYWWNDADREMCSRTVLWHIAVQIHDHVACAPYSACHRQYRKCVGLSDLTDRRNGFENVCIMKCFLVGALTSRHHWMCWTTFPEEPISSELWTR